LLDLEDPEPDRNPYIVVMDPDPGGIKTCGSATLLPIFSKIMTNKNARNLFIFRAGCSCTSVVDPDPDSLEMLDPDSKNPDPQH
jgi:hypothetical protein